jgi:hypothetical protein
LIFKHIMGYQRLFSSFSKRKTRVKQVFLLKNS